MNLTRYGSISGDAQTRALTGLIELRNALRGKIICDKCNKKPDRIEYAYNHRRDVLITDLWCHGKYLHTEFTREQAQKIVGVSRIIFPGDEPLLPASPKLIESKDET